ncbi:MAG: chemotaxis response regulator protein-glutamate methylesterase [Candidatus Gastranaerophilales bacterium]|nr:chemotaxis response regulator protein-glutamate methylesterase [Candidatus Gastranaerophilales bacterium]
MEEISNKKVNVLVVDDSSIMRRMIIDILKSHPLINVVGYATDGQMALIQLEKLKPDVITLDVEMPLMNGLETLKQIRKIRPTPTIMLSSLTSAGAEVTMQALELGAIDFIQKPENLGNIKNKEKEIISKVLIAALSENKTSDQHPIIKHNVKIPVIKNISKTDKVKTIIIGSSTGGPQALKEVIPYLPKNLPAQIIVVQHMPANFTGLLAQRLNKNSEITVNEAKEDDRLEAKKVFIAPGNYHLCIENNKIKLNQDPQIWGVRPAVDITLISAAKAYKEDLICVILTGMGHDGTKGAEMVRKHGGYCIVQDQSTSVIYGMPKCVIDAGHANEIVPLHKMANAIVNAVYR